MTNQVYKMVQVALDDCQKLNTEHQWAKLEVNHTQTMDPVVSIQFGTIHHNGMHERAIATRRYYLDTKGEVKHLTMAHA